MLERCLQIGWNLDEIARVRDFVSEEAKLAGLDEREAYHCTLAVDETCTNIIEHGYHSPDAAQAKIEICCHRRDKALIVTVSDDSTPFDPLEVPDPDPAVRADERSEGGWGIFFIKKFMDEVSYAFHRGRNVLTMIKYARNEPVAHLIHLAQDQQSNSPPFSLLQRSEKIMQIVPFGRYDARCATLISDEVVRMLSTGRTQFVMDLSNVSHITSGGMKVLVNNWHRVREKRGQFVLAAVPAILRELFELSGLDLIFTTVATVEQAEKLLRKRV